MNLGIVIQRYGPEVIGGAERLCRSFARRLARRHRVEVFSTCALDYLDWANHFPAGTVADDGVLVHRFPVEERRDPEAFGRYSDWLFAGPGSTADEEEWVRRNGPYAPALLACVRGRLAGREEGPALDRLIAFCFRYWPTYHALRAAGRRAVLIPTAEDDPVLKLEVMRQALGSPGGILYLTEEERDLVWRRCGNQAVAHEVIGAAIETPGATDPERFRRRFGIAGPFCLYVGRLDRNKGCEELYEYYPEFQRFTGLKVPLVLAGDGALAPAGQSALRMVGPLDEGEKFDALASASVLILPSRLESLSLVLLEAWSVGAPVLVNGACAVTRGQTVRAGGGLYYEGFREFAECLAVLLTRPELARRMGEGGRRYVEGRYRWEVIEERLLRFVEGLRARGTR